MDQYLAQALRNALNEADFDAAAMTEKTVAAWKDHAPAYAKTVTRKKLGNFTKKKKAWAEAEMGNRFFFGNGGLHQSYEEAFKWYEKSAKQRHAERRNVWRGGRCRGARTCGGGEETTMISDQRIKARKEKS